AGGPQAWIPGRGHHQDRGRARVPGQRRRLRGRRGLRRPGGLGVSDPMMGLTSRTVQQYVMEIPDVQDEDAALEAWRWYVKARGWSKVGEPCMVHADQGTFVAGYLVRTNRTVELSPDLRPGDTVCLPNIEI